MDAIQQAMTNINPYARSLRQLGEEPFEHVSLHVECRGVYRILKGGFLNGGREENFEIWML